MDVVKFFLKDLRVREGGDLDGWKAFEAGLCKPKILTGFLAFLLPDEKKQPSGKVIKVNLLLMHTSPHLDADFTSLDYYPNH